MTGAGAGTPENKSAAPTLAHRDGLAFGHGIAMVHHQGLEPGTP